MRTTAGSNCLLLAFATLSVLVVGKSYAETVTIDFDDTGPVITDLGGYNSVGADYIEDGFYFFGIVSSDEYEVDTEADMGFFGPFSFRYSGNAALYNSYQTYTGITRQGGGLFNLNEFSVSEINPGLAANITMEGVFYDGTFTSTIVRTDGIGITQETFTAGNDFSGFQNLKELRLYNHNPGHQLNSLTFDLHTSGYEPSGDLNSDGFVGIGDLNVVLSKWNQFVSRGVWLDGDPSGDNFVGIEDLNIVLGNWNAGTPPAHVVPEPVGLTLLVLGGPALMSQGRKGRSKVVPTFI
ncbi:MAG: hypothetical protein R3C45_09450 [Phycisphaerales bacterium]